MERMQEVVIAQIEGIIEAANRLPASESSWANIGNIVVLDRDSFDTLGRVGYDFQTGYYSLYLLHGSETAHSHTTEAVVNGTVLAVGERRKLSTSEAIAKVADFVASL